MQLATTLFPPYPCPRRIFLTTFRVWSGRGWQGVCVEGGGKCFHKLWWYGEQRAFCHSLYIIARLVLEEGD